MSTTLRHQLHGTDALVVVAGALMLVRSILRVGRRGGR